MVNFIECRDDLVKLSENSNRAEKNIEFWNCFEEKFSFTVCFFCDIINGVGIGSSLFLLRFLQEQKLTACI